MINGDDKARREYEQWQRGFAEMKDEPPPRSARLDLSVHAMIVSGFIWDAAASALRICVQQTTGEDIESPRLARYLDNDANINMMSEAMAVGW